MRPRLGSLRRSTDCDRKWCGVHHLQAFSARGDEKAADAPSVKTNDLFTRSSPFMGRRNKRLERAERLSRLGENREKMCPGVDHSVAITLESLGDTASFFVKKGLRSRARLVAHRRLDHRLRFESHDIRDRLVFRRVEVLLHVPNCRSRNRG